jgi:uncharacterized protein YkwD
LRPAVKTRFRPAVDALDARALPATMISASLVNGILTIVGTDASDIINISFRGRGPRAILNVNNLARFHVGQVAAIDVEASAGNDTVVINDRGRFVIPATIHAGPGFDQIQGGSGVDVIDGSSGLSVVVANPASTVVMGSGPMVVNGVLHLPTLSHNPAVNPQPVITSPPSTGSGDNTAPPATTPPPNTTPSNPGTPPNQVPPSPQVTAAQLVAQIIALTNQDRVSNGLAALEVNSQLTDAAQIHANDMASFETMAHTLPQAADPTLQSRAAAVGYNFHWLGENIALNYSDAQSLESAWMNSPEHRANILDANYTQFGVALAYDVLGEPYYCVVFGEPA